MKLHEQRDTLQIEIDSILLECQWMREYLASPKFQGEMEDYINVREVDDFILRIRALSDRPNI